MHSRLIPLCNMDKHRMLLIKKLLAFWGHGFGTTVQTAQRKCDMEMD